MASNLLVTGPEDLDCLKELTATVMRIEDLLRWQRARLQLHAVPPGQWWLMRREKDALDRFQGIILPDLKHQVSQLIAADHKLTAAIYPPHGT